MESASGICWKRNGVCFLALLQLTKPRFQCLFDEPGGGNTLPVSCSFRFPVELFVDMQDGCHTGSLAFARFLSRAYLAGLQQLIQERFNRPGEFGGLVVVHHVAGIRDGFLVQGSIAGAVAVEQRLVAFHPFHHPLTIAP